MIRSVQKSSNLVREIRDQALKIKPVISKNSNGKHFGNLSVQQLNESESIVKAALRESITQYSNPKKDTIYNEEYF
jgi:hypothetical protein